MASLCPARPTTGRDDRPDLWDLVDQARAGDAEAFAALVRGTVDTIHPYVLRRMFGDHEAADEITADVYLAAWRSLADVRRTATSPVAWLRTIATRRAIDYHRGWHRRNVVAVDPDDLGGYRPTATTAGALADRSAESVYVERAQAAARSRVLWAHVRRLAPDQYKVLRCRFGVGLSLEETAAELGKPTSAVKSLQYRAVRELRARLAGADADPDSAAA